MFYTGFGVVTFFVANHHHAAALKTGKTTDDGLVFAKQAVAGKRGEIFEKMTDIVGEMRPIRMACNLRLLPRGQLAIGALQQFGQLILQACDLICDIDFVITGKMTEFFDLAFKFGDRFFKIEEVMHQGIISDWETMGRNIVYRPATSSVEGAVTHIFRLRKNYGVCSTKHNDSLHTVAP